MSEEQEQEFSEMLGCITIIQIISFESERIESVVIKAADSHDRDVYKWDFASSQLQFFNKDRKKFIDKEEKEVSEILEWFQSDEADKCILILEDFYPFLQDSPKNISIFRNIARHSIDKNLVLSQPIVNLPKELEKDVHVITLELPDKHDLMVVFEHCCKVLGVPMSDDEDLKEKLVESALGLSIMEARKIFKLVLQEDRGKLKSEHLQLIVKEKERIIKNSGFLEYYHHQESLKDVGGLDNLKDWLTKRGRAYDKSAREYGLEIPKGVLLLGIPGTGKSLCAKAIGYEWQFPIIKLDMGRIFGGIVGESENNIRQALQIAEAISPSILWIDEIEKGFSGLSSSGSTDGGTTSRVLGTFLSWMQDKKKPVFVVATANNIDQLPPELLRKGRIDEIFFVDLPTFNARKEIIKIHLKRLKRDPNKFDLDNLAESMVGFSGAEIEECIKDALFQSFDAAEEIKDSYIMQSAKKTYPISKTMHENIDKMRKWAKARAVLASSEEFNEFIHVDTKIPTLKQENSNPFL